MGFLLRTRVYISSFKGTSHCLLHWIQHRHKQGTWDNRMATAGYMHVAGSCGCYLLFIQGTGTLIPFLYLKNSTAMGLLLLILAKEPVQERSLLHGGYEFGGVELFWLTSFPPLGLLPTHPPGTPPSPLSTCSLGSLATHRQHGPQTAENGWSGGGAIANQDLVVKLADVLYGMFAILYGRGIDCVVSTDVSLS